MSDGADPPRLSRDSGSAVERRLGALVEGSRGDVGTDEQLAQLEARLLSLIGPPGTGGPPAPSGGGSAAATGVTGALKAAVAVVVLGAAAAVAFLAHRTAPPVPVPRGPSSDERAPVASAAPVPPSAPGPAEETSPRDASPAASVTAPAASREASPLPTEADLVGQAQVALGANPGRALSLCDKHRRLYPHGVLVQEREVLAIDALERLGRRAEAVERGARFLKAFPGSAHRSKILSIVGPR